jgi:DNA repair exonuclease SbcCD ATPase subunit
VKKELGKMKLKRVEARGLFKLRDVSEEKVKEAKERFEKAKQRFEDNKKELNESRHAFKEALKNKNATGAIENAKVFLTSSADAVINAIEKIKSKVSENNDLTQEEADNIISEMDAKIKEMQDAKAKVAAATTKEEIKAAGKEIVRAWERMKNIIKIHAERQVLSKTNEVVKMSEQLEKRLEATLEKLSEKGYNTTGINSKIDEFSAKINDAREKYNEAVLKFAAAKEARAGNATANPDATALLKAGKSLMEAAHKDLKDAHEILKGIISEIRKVSGKVELEQENETEVVVEDEAVVNATSA